MKTVSPASVAAAALVRRRLRAAWALDDVGPQSASKGSSLLVTGPAATLPRLGAGTPKREQRD